MGIIVRTQIYHLHLLKQMWQRTGHGIGVNLPIDDTNVKIPKYSGTENVKVGQTCKSTV